MHAFEAFMVRKRAVLGSDDSAWFRQVESMVSCRRGERSVYIRRSLTPFRGLNDGPDAGLRKSFSVVCGDFGPVRRSNDCMPSTGCNHERSDTNSAMPSVITCRHR